MVAKRRFRAAFAPTVDCAILVAAAEKGFASDEGVALELIKKKTSGDILADWSAEELQGAHLPASLPLASGLPGTQASLDLIVPFILATGGCSLVVSRMLHDDLVEQGMKIPEPGSVSRAVSRVALARRTNGSPVLRFATEHPSSPSTAELIYLIESARLITANDVTLIEAAPVDMPGLLADGRIDGFYAAEPYGSAVTLRDLGRIVTTKAHVWENAAEKVLVVSDAWAADHEQTLHALLRALYRAGEWCASHANIEELADLLSAPDYLNCHADLILPSLSGFIPHSPTRLLECPGFLSLSRNWANFPWQSQAIWFFNQMMQANGSIEDDAVDEATIEAAAGIFRPDIFRRALKPIFAPMPSAVMTLEEAVTRHIYLRETETSYLHGPESFFDTESQEV